jgi:hypothetical protein
LSQAELDLLQQRCRDLEATVHLGGKQKQQQVAARLVSLSEEVRTGKLMTLQQRRQICVLRQEKKHLHSLLAAIESSVENLEEIKITAETEGLLSEEKRLARETEYPQLAVSDLSQTAADIRRIKEIPPLTSGTSRKQPRASGFANAMSIMHTDLLDPAFADLDFEISLPEMAPDPQSLGSKEVERLTHRVAELQRLLDERDRHIDHFEKENLASLNNAGSHSTATRGKSSVSQEEDRVKQVRVPP